MIADRCDCPECWAEAGRRLAEDPWFWLGVEGLPPDYRHPAAAHGLGPVVDVERTVLTSLRARDRRSPAWVRDQGDR